MAAVVRLLAALRQGDGTHANIPQRTAPPTDTAYAQLG
jgi:hypothetical protein